MGRSTTRYLQLVSSLVVVELPAAAGHDHEDLLLGQGAEGAVQQDLQLGGDGVAALQDGPGHLVHGRGAGDAHLLALLLAQAQVPQSWKEEGVKEGQEQGARSKEPGDRRKGLGGVRRAGRLGELAI